jgi:transposase
MSTSSHHVSSKPVEAGGRGPTELTGMVDLTRDAQGKVHARLLDLVPGRSGRASADWLAARTTAFRTGIKVATLHPFHGYNNAIGDQLEDATAVLDAFYDDLLVMPMWGWCGPVSRADTVERSA